MTASEWLVVVTPYKRRSGMHMDTHRQESVEKDAQEVGVQQNIAERRVDVRSDILDA